jgi:hypothetical protein
VRGMPVVLGRRCALRSLGGAPISQNSRYSFAANIWNYFSTRDLEFYIDEYRPPSAHNCMCQPSKRCYVCGWDYGRRAVSSYGLCAHGGDNQTTRG